MNDDQKQKCIAFLASKKVDKCSICKSERLTIQHVVDLESIDTDAPGHGHVLVLPMVPVVCADCGHANLFSAQVIGIVSNTDPLAGGRRRVRASR